MDEVVALLGEPGERMGDPPSHSPHRPYWLYGNLELQFDLPEDAAPYVEFLQIDMPERLRKKARRLAKNLMLELHGLNCRSRPSQFIRAIDDIDRVELSLINSGYPYVTMYVDDFLEINFDHWSLDPIEAPPPLRGYIRRLDTETSVVDLYSFDARFPSTRSRKAKNWPERYAPFTVTGRDYLKALER
ncbi:hypothetical protein [Ancylobacter terrae]|uniref:hypothetical protein n=1 Tax=Ancylobacter sp. sgz301288 TaxID=3342077 RepID=UPI00385ED6CE